MSFFSLLWTFLIGPLKLLFEVIFDTAYDLVLSPGVSIVILSLAMNVLVLPLYRRADAMQERARDTEAALKKGVDHIKKTFSGNERMMMLQTYYRQNHYSPANALKGSVSLLLEIPFFMAAYQFLSGLGLLQGVAFGPIADLSAPDGLLKIGALTLNLLPILMTAINFISAAIYLKGFPLKTKIQLYGMAVFFLFFLYSSPSGLVFYWTLNNVFSLCKNIFYKLKQPGKVIAWITFFAGLALLGLLLGADAIGAPQLKQPIVLVVGAVLMIPLGVRLYKKYFPPRRAPKDTQPDRKLFVLAAVFLTLFIGVLIPSAYVASSPQEFVDVTYFFNPIWYVVNSGVLAAGFFLLWFGVFYWLASPRGKVLFERTLWVFCGIAAVNYMFFGRGLGIVSSTLKFVEGMYFSAGQVILNYLVLAALAVLLLLVLKKWKKAVTTLLLAASFAVAVMAGINSAGIGKDIGEIRVSGEETMPHFSLSKEGKNVIVLMLDRQLGEMIPYLTAEKPELLEMFDGFTYYSNVVSYGAHTNMGVPAMLGGYEYTPVELNKRDKELLVDKHNEALKVLPVSFLKEGYDVTVCDPPYAGYSWVPDLSVFSDYPEISTYITKGVFGTPEEKQRIVEGTLRNFFCFSLMKSCPLGLEVLIYDNGMYHACADSAVTGEQEIKEDSLSVATGINQAFLNSYNVLKSLNTMTKITEEGDTYLFLCNDTPHEGILLQEPEYEPADRVDNTAYDEAHRDRFTVDGITLHVDNQIQMVHYQTDMAVLLAVGEWLDYLREAGVYDNTRIIIAADHGYFTHCIDELDLSEDGVRYKYAGSFFPLLMVKDFNARGFKTDDSFMSNADIPTIALSGLVEEPKNPFTGNPINDSEKWAHDQFIMTDHSLFDVKENNGYQYLPTTWAAVSKNIWDRSDWEFIDEPMILTEHEMPE